MKQYLIFMSLVVAVLMPISNGFSEMVSDEEWARVLQMRTAAAVSGVKLIGAVGLEGEQRPDEITVSVFQDMARRYSSHDEEGRFLLPTGTIQASDDGRFEVFLEPDVEGALVSVVFSAPRYRPQMRLLRLGKGMDGYSLEPVFLSAMNDPQQAVIAGFAFDVDPRDDLRISGMKFLKDVIVRVMGQGGDFYTQTDSDGFYVLSVPEGSYAVMFARADHFFDKPGDLPVSEDHFAGQLGWQRGKRFQEGDAARKMIFRKGETKIVNYQASLIAW